MYSINYSIKGGINYDTSGRPTVPLVLYQIRNDVVFQNRIDDMLFDTGAVLTSLNKKVADVNNYPIIKKREPILLGFNDFGRAIRSLVKMGKSEAEAKSYLAQFAGRSKDLLDSLHNDFNITDIGLVCDLRKISYATLFDYVINDVIVATPSDDDVIIAEVIGMNILEKFHFAIDYEDSSLYIEKCMKGMSRINPEFKCGTVSLVSNRSKH